MRRFSYVGLLKLAGWEDPPAPPVAKQPRQQPVSVAPQPRRQPAPVARPPKPGDPVQIPERVADFFNDIQLATKKEFGGVPGKDYNDYRYKPNFWENANITYSSPDSNGVTLPWGHIRIPLTEQNTLDEPTLVHELQHFLTRDTVPFAPSGKSQKDIALLTRGYPFEKSDMDTYPYGLKWWGKRIETSPTNAEYRYQIYSKMWDEARQTGKPKPTYEDFKKRLSQMSDDDYAKKLEDSPGGYIESLLSRYRMPRRNDPRLGANPHTRAINYHRAIQQWRKWRPQQKGMTPPAELIKAFRRAMMEVAQNRTPTQAPQGYGEQVLA